MVRFKPTPTAPTPGTSQVWTDVITDRNGHVWTLHAPALCGQYVTGDWWVYGSVRVIDISPEPKTITDAQTGLPRFVNGSQINPSTADHLVNPNNPSAVSARQAFDEGMYYDSKKHGNEWAPFFNAQLKVTPPFNLDPGDSLVSTWTEVRAAGSRPQVQRAAILTCVSSIPDDDDFRPAYGKTKGPTFNYASVDLDADARKLDPTGTTPLALATVEGWFDGPWLAHIPGNQKREIAPGAWMPDYSREHTVRLSVGALTLMRNDLTAAQLKPLAAGMIQAAIDWYYMFQDVPDGAWMWATGAGQNNGVRPLLLLGGYLLGDATQFDALVGNEVNQPFHVAETSTGVYNYGIGGYGATRPGGQLKWAALGDPEWGSAQYVGEDGTLALHPFRYVDTTILWDQEDQPPIPYTPTPDQKEAVQYRRCCSANTWWGEALFILAAGLRSQWNTGLLDADAWFEYLDRYRIVESGKGGTLSFITQWPIEMWDLHRATYLPAVWTGTDAPYGTLEIDDTDSPYAALPEDEYIECDATSGNIVVDLPAVSNGKVFIVKKVDASANTVTVDGNGAETIDGAATQVLTTQYDTLVIRGVGGHWSITSTI